MKLAMLIASFMVIVGCTEKPAPPPIVDTDFTIKGNVTTIKVHKKDSAVMNLDNAKKQISKLLEKLDQ